MKIGFKLLLIILFFQSIALFGQEKVDLSQWQGKSRPRIGFVLGGGGARGAAHIGVLKYLYEQGIPVDYVVGTSMGSIIGALYCVGYTPEELENLIAEMDWSIYMKDAVDRKYYSTEEKERREKFLLTVPFNTRGAFRNPFTNSSVQGNSTNVISTLPSSFVNGSNLQNLFNDLTFDYSGTDTDFNDLPINFACIATDILTGEEVVINKGDLPLAIRASMAIPGLFAPVDYDGRLLVDGGLVNNFPSDVCRSMGADIIIGSEVAKGKIESLDDLKSLPQLLAQMKNLAVEGKNVENRKLCNYYFHPDLSGFGMLSFSADAIHTLVQAGYEQAKEHDAEIQELKKLLARYPADKERLKAPHTRNFQNTEVNINNVDFHGITDKEESFLTRKSHLTPNTVFDGKKLNESVSIIKGTGSFSRVVYKLNKIDSTHYDVDMRLQRIEPHTISLGFRYDSEESAALLLGLGINSYQLSGLKFKVDARLSYNPRITTTLTWAALSFASINLSYEFFSPHYDIYYESMLFESNTGKSHTFTLSISEFHMRYLSMKAGVFRESKKIKGALSSLFLNSKTTYRKLGAFASVRFDSRDDVAYAKKGMYFNAEAQLGFSDDYELSHKIIDSDSAIYDINGDFRIYISPYNGPVTLIPQVRFRSVSGNYNADFDANYFGGSIDKRYYNSHLAFLGDDDLTWTYANVAILRLDVRWNFYKKHYLTGSYNYLHSTNTIESFFGTDDEFEKLLTKNYHGIAVKYTYRSVIGPISLQYHYSDVKDSSGLYFSLGYDF